MGWIWQNDDESNYNSSSPDGAAVFGGSSSSYADDNSGHCATRKVVSSQCRTVEVEPGKFVLKCEKTEQIFKDCVGRPSEMVQSNKEYTEEDVTDQMTGGSFPFGSVEHGPSYFPGLRNDIEAIERSLFGGFDRFLQAAEEMKNDFFTSVGVPHLYDAPPSRHKHGIPIEGHSPKEASPNDRSDGEVDLSGLARDV